MSGTNSRGLLPRILPSRLGSRVALTILLTSLVVLAMAVGGIALVGTAIRPTYENDAAHATLSQIEQSIGQQGLALRASSAPLGVAARMREAAVSGEMPEDLRATLDAYAGTIAATAVVFTGRDGDTVYAYGSPRHVTALKALLADPDSARWDHGAYDLRDGPVLVGRRGITGVNPDDDPVGQLMVAAPLTPESIPVSGRLAFEDPEANTLSVAAARTLERPGFDDVLVASEDEQFHLEAEVLGVDRRPATTIAYHDTIILEPLGSAFGLYALIVTILAGLVGLSVGMVVARAIARPINELSDHLDARREDTIAGREVGAIEIDPMLPNEFAHLLDTFNITFRELRSHQTALAQARDDAQAAHESLGIAIQDSPEGKMLVRDGAIAVFNPAAVAHLGVPAEAVLGQAPDEAFRSASFTNERGESLDAGAMRDQSMAGVTVQVDQEGRATRWLEIRTVTHGEERQTALVTTRDVTESRRLEELRAEIIGLVSHDLRAPLTVISGYLDLLSRPLAEAAHAKAVGSAQRSADRMRELLEDLLAATRAEEMFAPGHLLPVELNEIVQDTVASFTHTSPHMLGISMSCDATVLGEERRIRQVLVNLLTNAMKYSPPDSHIRVSLTCIDRSAVLAVEDEGPGIPADMREAIFERFARLEDESGVKHPGVGLGLYIVRAIVESHGGRVHVEDRPGGPGARFVVSLPLETSEPVAES